MYLISSGRRVGRLSYSQLSHSLVCLLSHDSVVEGGEERVDLDGGLGESLVVGFAPNYLQHC